MILFMLFQGACYECAVELFKATNECYLCRKVLINIDFYAKCNYKGNQTSP